MQDLFHIRLNAGVKNHFLKFIKILIGQLRSIESHGNRQQGACNRLHGQIMLLHQVHGMIIKIMINFFQGIRHCKTYNAPSALLLP